MQTLSKSLTKNPFCRAGAEGYSRGVSPRGTLGLRSCALCPRPFPRAQTFAHRCPLFPPGTLALLPLTLGRGETPTLPPPSSSALHLLTVLSFGFSPAGRDSYAVFFSLFVSVSLSLPPSPPASLPLGPVSPRLVGGRPRGREGRMVVLSLVLGLSEQDDFANIPDLQNPGTQQNPAQGDKRYERRREPAVAVLRRRQQRRRRRRRRLGEASQGSPARLLDQAAGAGQRPRRPSALAHGHRGGWCPSGLRPPMAILGPFVDQACSWGWPGASPPLSHLPAWLLIFHLGPSRPRNPCFSGGLVGGGDVREGGTSPFSLIPATATSRSSGGPGVSEGGEVVVGWGVMQLSLQEEAPGQGDWGLRRAWCLGRP